MDSCDEEIVGNAIRLSLTLRAFLGRNKNVLDRMAGIDVITPALLEELREESETLYEARLKRVQAARNPGRDQV